MLVKSNRRATPERRTMNTIPGHQHPEISQSCGPGRLVADAGEPATPNTALAAPATRGDNARAAIKANAAIEPPGVCLGLATLPRDAHVNAAALARILGKSRRSIDRGAARGDLPPPIVFFGKRVWTVGKILDFLNAKQTEACEKAERHSRKIAQRTP